jgi:hypothetical protein
MSAIENQIALEMEFERAMPDTCALASRYNYFPTVFKGMVQEHGGVGTARRLLAKSGPQTGLSRLCKLGRLDLSMEAIVLQDRFCPLFTDAEIEEARRTLDELGYFKKQHP